MIFVNKQSSCANGIEWEYNFLENVDNCKIRENVDFKESQRRCNIQKNRYSNVLANDSTRILLQAKKYDNNNKLIPGYDYINATSISLDSFGLQKSPKDMTKNSSLQNKQILHDLFLDPAFHSIFKYSIESNEKHNTGNDNGKLIPLPPWSIYDYIATQNPMQNTLLDFWEMIIEQDCFLLLNLNNEDNSIQQSKNQQETSASCFEDKLGQLWEKNALSSIAPTLYCPLDKKHPLIIYSSRK